MKLDRNKSILEILEDNKKSQLTASEMGRLGGKAILDKYGKQWFSQLQKKSQLAKDNKKKLATIAESHKKSSKSQSSAK